MVTSIVAGGSTGVARAGPARGVPSPSMMKSSLLVKIPASCPARSVYVPAANSPKVKRPLASDWLEPVPQDEQTQDGDNAAA